MEKAEVSIEGVHEFEHIFIRYTLTLIVCLIHLRLLQNFRGFNFAQIRHCSSIDQLGLSVIDSPPSEFYC